MELREESVTYQYQSLLFQPQPGEEWGPNLEVQAQHFLPPNRLKGMVQQLMQVKSQIASEREMMQVPPEMQPIEAGFIDLPGKLLHSYQAARRKNLPSELAQIIDGATRVRESADRVVILGIGGSFAGSLALFQALRNSYHNEMPTAERLGVPRIYFEGNNVDNDAMQELLDMLQITCIDPERREERWAVVVVSKSGKTLETAAALRTFRKEAFEFYGSKSEWLKKLVVPVTGPGDTSLRALFKADGYSDDDIFTIPERVGGRFSVFTAAGLLPAAIMGLDIQALLLGASSMTQRFLEEPFERNPVLQFAAVNYLMSQELGKKIRILSVWSKKLEGLGLWYDQLVAESLGKLGQGPTPLTAVQTRDLHSRGQQHQEGTRDKLITNVVVKAPRLAPIAISMADRNEDNLNELNRKTYVDMMEAAWKGTSEAYADVARPTADIILPAITEHTIGQLMQMLMLATVVEGRLMGINPYGQPGVEAYKRKMQQQLRGAKEAQPSGNTRATSGVQTQPIPVASPAT